MYLFFFSKYIPIQTKVVGKTVLFADEQEPVIQDKATKC